MFESANEGEKFTADVLQKFQEQSVFKTPQDHTLGSLFCSYIASKYDQFCEEITNIKSTSVSFDHSYKVALKVLMRTDGAVKKQFDSLLMCINQDGAIIWFAFLHNQSLKDAEKSFRVLAQRNSISHVYTDNCCSDRSFILRVFGDHCSVKLDLYHAIQRPVTAVKKSIPTSTRLPFMRELSACFRRKGDSDPKQRCFNTPPEGEIASNLHNLIDKWKPSQIPAEALQKVEVLATKHAKCLGNMEPSAGTGVNEVNHREINALFHKTKVSIMLKFLFFEIFLKLASLVIKRLNISNVQFLV